MNDNITMNATIAITMNANHYYFYCFTTNTMPYRLTKNNLYKRCSSDDLQRGIDVKPQPLEN